MTITVSDPDAALKEDQAAKLLGVSPPVRSRHHGGPIQEKLYDDYRAAHARWHATKSEADRLAVRDAFNAWATVFLGETDSEPVETLAAQVWGAA